MKLLPHVLRELVAPAPRKLTASGEKAAEREVALEADTSPKAQVYKSWLDRFQVSVVPEESPRDTAKRLLAALEARDEALEAEIHSLEGYVVNRGAEANPARRRLERKRRERREVEEVVDRLWGKVNVATVGPIYKDGRAQAEPEPPRCRTCDREFRDTTEAFLLVGRCQKCRDELAAARTTERTWLDELLDAL